MDLFDKPENYAFCLWVATFWFFGFYVFFIKHTILNGFFRIQKQDVRQKVESTGGRNSAEPRIKFFSQFCSRNLLFPPNMFIQAERKLKNRV